MLFYFVKLILSFILLEKNVKHVKKIKNCQCHNNFVTLNKFCFMKQGKKNISIGGTL